MLVLYWSFNMREETFSHTETSLGSKMNSSQAKLTVTCSTFAVER